MKPLETLTVVEAVSGLKNKEFSCVDLLTACLKRIKKCDSKIKAFITINDNALKLAEEADKLIKKKGSEIFDQKPLLGIPYAAKDNYSTKGIKTTAGSKVLKNYVPPFDATVIKKLNEAGAVLIGKTNLDAFAHGSSTETSDFFVTKNPWNLKKVPGGSSGGSAAAVAADMCLFATATETAGSTRVPSSWCGVVGVKPSYGLVSRYGVVAMASSFDSPGPICKNIEDAALVLSIMAGGDPLDSTSLPGSAFSHYENIKKYSLKNVRIGKPSSYFEIDLEKGTKEKVLEAVEVFKSLGAEIVEVDLLDPRYSVAVYTILQRSEVSSNLARLDGIRYGGPRTDFGFEAKKRVMLGTYALNAGYYDAYYSKAQKVRTLIVEDFKKVFSKVNFVIAPSTPCVALNIGESSKSAMFGEMMDILEEPSSIAGICGVSVPCGFYKKLPVGVQLMGKSGDDQSVLGALYKYEQAAKLPLEKPKI